MKLRILAGALAVSFSLSGAPALAATQIVDGGGNLTGATGVLINGSVYTVDFVDGTCSSVFGGSSAACDSTSNLAFTNFTDAETAAQALLDQVFLDTGLGQFDSNYTLTNGCATNSAQACYAKIPYAAGLSANAINSNTTDSVNLALTSTGNTSTDNQFVYARFTLTGSVPEPSTWAMMLVGFGALGFAMRRQRSAKALAA
jgi:hypothetical protein